MKSSYLRPQARTPQEYLGETKFRVEMVKQTDKVSKILYRQNVKLRKEKLQAGRYETDRLGTIFSEFPFPIDTTYIRVLRGDMSGELGSKLHYTLCFLTEKSKVSSLM